MSYIGYKSFIRCKNSDYPTNGKMERQKKECVNMEAFDLCQFKVQGLKFKVQSSKFKEFRQWFGQLTNSLTPLNFKP